MVSLDGQPMISFEARFDLQQKAAKVTGSFQTTSYPVGTDNRGPSTIKGSIANDVLTFEVARAILIGELTIDGDEMKGNGLVGNSRRVSITLRRVEVAAPPGSPPR